MDEKIKKVLVLAESLLGRPYQYGATEDNPEAFDCSSFVQYVFKHGAEIQLPRSAILQAADEQGKEINPVKQSDFLPGDLLFMRSDRGHYNDDLFAGQPIDIGHVVFYLGNDEIIHAKSSLGGIIKQKLTELISDPHYKIVKAKRFFLEDQEINFPLLSQYQEIKDINWQNKSCGIVALKMCLESLNLISPDTKELLRAGIEHQAYLRDIGWSHSGLVELGQKYGAKQSQNFDWAKLSSQNAFAQLWLLIGTKPIIASVYKNFQPENGGGHLVVVAGVTDNKFVIYDPEEKDLSKIRKIMPIKKFVIAWKKRIIVVA